MVRLLKDVVAMCAQDGLCGCTGSRSRPRGGGTGGQVGTSSRAGYGKWEGVWAIGSHYDGTAIPPIPKVIHVTVAAMDDDEEEEEGEEDDLLLFDNHPEHKPLLPRELMIELDVNTSDTRLYGRPHSGGPCASPDDEVMCRRQRHHPYALRRSCEGLDRRKNCAGGPSASVSSSLSASTGTGEAQILTSWSDVARPAITTAFVLPAPKQQEHRQQSQAPPPKQTGISDFDGSSYCSSRDDDSDEECGFFWFGAKSSISESSSSSLRRRRRRHRRRHPSRRTDSVKGLHNHHHRHPLGKKQHDYPAAATAPTEASSFASF